MNTMLNGIDLKMTSWVRKWKPFILRYAKMIGLSHTDEEDWFQVAHFAYWGAAKKWDESKACSFDAFVLNMVKFRLLDLQRRQYNKNRHWLINSITLEEANLEERPAARTTLNVDVSKDSETILLLILLGHKCHELERKLGIPASIIDRAKDEAALHFVKGGNMKLRSYFEDRATELGVEFDDAMEDFELANAILLAGSSVHRTFRIVSPASTTDGDEKSKVCKADGCQNTVVEDSRFCSLKCAETTFINLRRGRQGKTQVNSHVRSAKELADLPYQGEIGQEVADALPNPFAKKTAAHWVFELFRIGGTKSEMAERLDPIIQAKQIKCTSPMERVRRVITDTRRLGFELPRSSTGIFRLTGRRK